MTNKSDDLRQTIYQPAAVLVVDLVGHSKRSRGDIQKIQKIMEDAFSRAINALKLVNVHHNYTGDGYVCALLGDSSVRAIDFINLGITDLIHRLKPFNQNIRVGFDYGILNLKYNILTKSFEHFNLPGIQATRLEHASEPGQILATETAFNIFSPLYPNSFDPNIQDIKTKDRTIRAYVIRPVDYLEIKQIFTEYLFEESLCGSNSLPPNGKNGILIVDDDNTFSSIITDLINSLFPHLLVFSCDSGSEAISLCRKHPIGIVITDYIMPGLSGLELTVQLLNFDRNLIITMLTGYYTNELNMHFYEHGGCFVLSKPVGRCELVKIINLACCGWITRFKTNANYLTENPYVILQQLNKIVILMNSIMHKLPQSEKFDISTSLIRHKAQHLKWEFLKTIIPGNNIMIAFQSFLDELKYLSRLYGLARQASVTPMIAFLTQYVEDFRKLNDSINIELKIDRKLKNIKNNNDGGALFALIISELIDNARSALDSAGNISVSISLLQNTHSLCAIIADNGPGVAPDIQSQIFENGFSTKGPERGFGLFLAKEGLSSLGGDIRYQTKGGAHFTLILPIR